MKERYQDTKKASYFGIIGNIFLFIIKIIIGFISNSQAMLADAINSGSDILNSILTFIGNRIASKTADDDHNLGHGKAEYIYSLIISIIMLMLGYKVIYRSAKSLMKPELYNYSIWLIIICIITIITKLTLYIYTNKIAKKHNNILVKANANDHRNDCFITISTLISVILTANNIRYIDSIVAILIGIWIIINASSIFINSYDVLMDKTCPEEIKKEVLSIVKRHKEIEKVTHFNATPVGYQYQISFSIFVDGNLTTFASHEIANNLEKEIDKEVEEIYLTVIHVNPIKK